MIPSQKIENPKTQHPETPELNDRDILNNALSTEKHLCNSFVTAMHEASHDSLYKVIFDIMEDTSQQQRKFYDLAFKHGWYALTAAGKEEITQLEQQFSGYKQQLQ